MIRLQKKVLHIINSVHGGGAERLVNEWAASTSKQLPITVLSIMKLPDQYANHPNYISLNCRRTYSIGALFKLARYIKNYDVIHVHLFPCQLYVAILSLFFHRKFITTEHNTSNRRRDKKLFRYIDRWMYRRYQTIGCISAPVEKNLKDHVSQINTLVIPNGINLQRIRKSIGYSKKDLGYADDIVLVGMFSRFSHQKNHDLVIDALTKLPDHFHAVFVGDGERRKEIERLAQDSSVAHRVKFLGFRNDVYEIMKSCDIIVQSSHWEGFGLVVIEGLACEKPVYVSDVEGMRDLVSPEYRFTSSDTLVALLLDDELSKPETNNLNDFDIIRMIRSYENIYAQ